MLNGAQMDKQGQIVKAMTGFLDMGSQDSPLTSKIGNIVGS